MSDERGSDRGMVKEASRKGRDEAIDMDRTWRDRTKIWIRSSMQGIVVLVVFTKSFGISRKR
jgi:hypothetical protein